jgi:hypothetical protein
VLEVGIQLSIERLSSFSTFTKFVKHFGKRGKIGKGDAGGEVEGD